jgi:hypothetical protein
MYKFDDDPKNEMELFTLEIQVFNVLLNVYHSMSG